MSEPTRPEPPEVGLPTRIDTRRALVIYVDGRTRTLDPTRKNAAAGGPATLPYVVPDGAPAAEESMIPRSSVPVPGRLRFHRGAGKWRENAEPAAGGWSA
jgi:hypothetical protein